MELHRCLNCRKKSYFEITESIQFQNNVCLDAHLNYKSDVCTNTVNHWWKSRKVPNEHDSAEPTSTSDTSVSIS